MGMGDRFAHQGEAQLRAVQTAWANGIEVYPVWNKSNREHTLIGSCPDDLRAEADAAVAAAGWTKPYYVDADHIGLKTVDWFLPGSNFFTLDVADFTGKPAGEEAIEAFVQDFRRYLGSLAIPGIEAPFEVTEATLRSAAGKFLLAIQEAGRIYRHIAGCKGAENFVTEISVDETDLPQTPIELFLILAMIAREGIPVQTIAPKFTGRFNKGVDYVGEVPQFVREFDEDLAVVAFAIREFGLPETLKLSVHSGSDKFSLYPHLNRLIQKHQAGLHVKTAGTTWLEELTGLAEAGGSGLSIAREIYAKARASFDELTAPYATVIDIDRSRLPAAEEVAEWTSEQFVNAIAHVPEHPDYNPHFRQLAHVGFKKAAQMGARFTDALKEHEAIIGKRVTENLWTRHLRPIFGRDV